MKNHSILYTAYILLLLPLVSIANPGAIIGTWMSASGEAKIEIYKTDAYYYGKIIWLSEPVDVTTGKPKVDENNPQKSLQNNHIIGLEILKKFEYIAKDNVWKNGTIYDPKSGKTYKCIITLKGTDQIDIRGYIGISIIGRTETWKKIKE